MASSVQAGWAGWGVGCRARRDGIGSTVVTWCKFHDTALGGGEFAWAGGRMDGLARGGPENAAQMPRGHNFS